MTVDIASPLAASWMIEKGSTMTFMCASPISESVLHVQGMDGKTSITGVPDEDKDLMFKVNESDFKYGIYYCLKNGKIFGNNNTLTFR